MKAALQQFWKQATPQERWLLGGGAGLLLVVLLVFYVWQPLVHDRQKLRTSLPQFRLNAEQMRLSAAEVGKLKSLPVSVVLPKGGLRSVVETSAGIFKLRESLGQVNVEGNERISISMSKASFDSWVRLLGYMQEQYRIRLESCQVEALPEPGLVNIKAVLVGKSG